jgi:GT2 family glycosyltransferase
VRVDVSFSIPSYNGRQVLERALTDLLRAAPESEVIVVDGGSKDGSPEMVEAKFPSVRLLRQPNFGWGHATNRGIEVSTRPLVAMMNSDVYVERPALEACCARLAQAPEVGVVAPMLRLPDGREQHLWGVLSPLLYPPRARLARGAVGVPQVSGAFLVVRRKVLEEVGGIDENFFFYNEEWDFCRRVRKAGHRIELLRDQRVTHVGGGSTPQTPAFILEQLRGFLYYLSVHHPGPLAEVTRRAMSLQGHALARLDRREEHQQMWARLAVIADARRLLDSPFPLSGRGIPRFDPLPDARGGAASEAAPA